METPISYWFFWGSLSLMIYIYFGFPVLAVLRGLFRPKPLKRGQETPTVSVVIAAYNEAAVITKKLDNTLELDYPSEKLEIIVASDGSDDGTNELVASYNAPEVQLLALPRQGKNSALNAAVALAQGDILVFSDADTLLVPDALRHVIAPFSDQEVGGVGGERRPAKYFDMGVGQRIVWSFKRGLNQLLSRAGSITISSGQIIAVRRNLFKPIPIGVCDDSYISFEVHTAHLRLLFEPRAAAYPFAGVTALHNPFRRKVRVTGRYLKTLWLVRHLFNPVRHGFFSVQLLSHKVLRKLQIIPLLLLAILAPMLWNYGDLYKIVTIGQLAFHGIAIIGFLLHGTRIGRFKLVKKTFTFDMLEVANIVAIVNLLRGKRYDIWDPQRAA